MKLTRRAAAWFFTLIVAAGLVPQTVFAEETTAFPLQYEVLQEINEDKTEATISLEFTETETVQLEKVTLPDGTEKTEDLTVITYTVSVNEKYDFKVDYFTDGVEQEETIPVEITELVEKKTGEEIPAEEKEKLTAVETTSNLLQADGNTYEVSSGDELTTALEQIENSQETEATIVLTADIGTNVKFVGAANKTITVKSTDGQKYALTLGSELVGDITLDNVKASAETLYCSGHRTIFTENCEFTISGTLYGGGKAKTVQSVYVKINGTGKINTTDIENTVVGGSYKGSVEGDIYVELAGNITYGNKAGHYLVATNKATAYGGDKPSGTPLEVGGNVTLILDGPVTGTAPQNIVGAYNSHVKGNVTVQVKAGYAIGIEGMREDPTQSIVDGDIHIIAGDPAYEGTDRICRIAANWDIVGAGEKINLTGSLFQVGGNVTIDTYENVWGWDKDGTPANDPPGIVGAGSATVAGKVTINAKGSHLEDIVGADNTGTSGSSVGGDILINAQNVDLRNSYNEKSGILPLLSGTKAGKDVTVNLDSGLLSGIYGYGGTVGGNMEINITGTPKFTDDEAGVWGVNNTDSKERSVLNFDKAKTSIPIVGYFTEMNVINESDVTLGNEKKNAFGTVYDVNINTNASLTTNKQAYSKGALTMDHGTWIAKGFLYVTTTTNTNNSKIVMNDYAAFGYGYKNDNAYDKTVVTSNDDIYTFNQCAYVDKIYGNSAIVNSTWNVFVPTMIGGNYIAASNKLNVLAFVDQENYPDEKIPLEILGTATGKTAVTLVDKTDTSKEGKPIVGQNYINALKVSEDTFELANKNAVSCGLYFKKLADANTEDKGDYDMWQVAKKDVYQVLYEFVSGTAGKQLPDAITDVLPIDSDKYAEGATVNAMQPDETEIAVSDGVWKFEGYDADSKVANTEHTDENGNIKFIGTWEFVKDKDAPIIFDESDKPSKPDSNKLNDHGSVETGDKTNILLWGIGTIISALAVLIVVSVKRKTNKS
ncbi:MULTISPECIES: SHIRT domain-containing protein [Lachnospiraceae]|jgi:hypothetical protein|uniref:SHIRT domain-containing protein n=1 Tax=Faecalicatena acetigenes TaxID=2981790 RepID=A0ABT2TB80_9FIRM|nr:MULTISPECIES: SHIRT domain-containing protein [Lachnospiraceae]MCU6747538.1 SHIRT domain-containing protein [Faecalicatena acetigenes]RGT75197.1 hypothetical protein DWX08_01760 [Ruminococcus sp. AF18-22]SCH94346.1 Uncharacterised protein [uncultured Clostridium sp.]